MSDLTGVPLPFQQNARYRYASQRAFDIHLTSALDISRERSRGVPSIRSRPEAHTPTIAPETPLQLELQRVDPHPAAAAPTDRRNTAEPAPYGWTFSLRLLQLRFCILLAHVVQLRLCSLLAPPPPVYVLVLRIPFYRMRCSQISSSCHIASNAVRTSTKTNSVSAYHPRKDAANMASSLKCRTAGAARTRSITSSAGKVRGASPATPSLRIQSLPLPLQ